MEYDVKLKRIKKITIESFLNLFVHLQIPYIHYFSFKAHESYRIYLLFTHGRITNKPYERCDN